MDKDFENELIKTINNDFGIDGKLLISQLSPNEILITGGIIQAIINNNKDYGDLDIVCCGKKNYERFTTFLDIVLKVTQCKGCCTLYFGDRPIPPKTQYTGELQEYKIPEEKQKCVKYKHPYCTHCDSDKIHKLRGLSLIDCVDNYIINGKCLQVIKLGESNIMPYIKSFDLDICRNYFDGYVLHCDNFAAIKAKNMTLYRYKDIDGKIVDSLLNERTTERLEKYKARGYKLIREIYDYV